jgi:hypothetical protein
MPGYETVVQWEERKGYEYPDTAPVYVKPKIIDEELKGWRGWHLQRNIGHDHERFFCVIATEAGAPPDDWRPE